MKSATDPTWAPRREGSPEANIDVGMKDNILRNNYVHHMMQFHDDGAAFYTLGRQQGTHVVDNWADTILATGLTGSYPVAGIYADNYSEFITYERNANVNCTKAINQNTGSGVQNIRLISQRHHGGPGHHRLCGPQDELCLAGQDRGREHDDHRRNRPSLEHPTPMMRGSLSARPEISALPLPVRPEPITSTRLMSPGTPARRVTGCASTERSVDSWTAEPTPVGTGLQIRHRIKRAGRSSSRGCDHGSMSLPFPGLRPRSITWKSMADNSQCPSHPTT